MVPIILIIALFFIIVKTIGYYLLKTKKKSYKDYIYFSENNLNRTKSSKRKNWKIILNIMTIAIIALLLMAAGIFIMQSFGESAALQKQME